jgi:G6PDH family F420-dependent oxidoreductase
MPELGFAISSEDHPPKELVRQAALAERAGFTFCLISDHYHPWTDAQGHSPFVWSTLGGIAQATEKIRVGTGEQTHRGTHYTVDHARVYDVPDKGVEVYVAATAPNAAELAGRIGDGFISTAPEEKYVQKFESAGGKGKQKLGMMHCAYDSDEKKGLERATKLWPNLALQGPLGQELATPSDFEEAAAMVEEEDVAETTPCGPDPEPYLKQIEKYADAGFTHVYVHQIGDNQDEFAEFAAKELMPKL